MAILCNLMVMFIASIISIVLLLISYLLIIIFGFRLKNNPYELMTVSPRWVKVINHVLFVIGIVFVSASFLNIEHPAFIALLVLGDFIALFGLAFLFFFTFQYEAIKGDSVFVRRFIRVKEIKIKDIVFINAIYSGYIFTCKDGSAFSISSKTQKVADFIKMLDERRKKNSDESDSIDEAATEKSTFSEVGKEIRDMIPTFKKNWRTLMIATIAFTLIAVGTIVGVSIVLSEKGLLIFAIVVGLVLLLLPIIALPMTKKQYEKDLNQSDEYLGKKYLLLSKDVKGAAKRRFKTNLKNFIIVACAMLVVAVISGLISSFQKPVEESNLILVSGKFEYVRYFNDDCVIGLKDNPVEYRISSIELHETDRSFKEELHAGDTVYLYVDGTRENHPFKYQDKTAWNYAYVFKTDSKTYLSYEGYLRANARNARLGFIICYVSLGAAIIALGSIPFAYIRYKKDAKKERIEL
ncbi:MAG: hypothetical protein IKQ78_03550 [Bacilli bacterium]|nr:hypothetical protein [Bacilli bacterium]